MKIFKFVLILSSILLHGCFAYGDKKNLTLKTETKVKTTLDATLSSVDVSNNHVTIVGTGFSNITTVKIKGNGVDADLSVDSISSNQIIASATNALSLLVGGTFELIIASAEAQASYPITFTLQNGAVVATSLAQMGAANGQVLKWNGSVWAPASLASSQTYQGNWNASAHTPDITSLGSFQSGDYLIVNTAGSYTSSVLVTSPTSFAVGDWIMFNGAKWEKINNTSNVVTSFQARNGAVVLLPSDYVSLKDATTHKVTGSSLNDLADIDLTTVTPTNGQTIKWNSITNKWEPRDEEISGGAGSVDATEIAIGSITNTHISATAAIAQSKINNLTTDLAAKEGTITAGTTAQYYRGDKTFQALNTTAVAEGTNLYYTDARTLATPITAPTLTNSAIAAGDTVQVALGKAQAQITARESAVTAGTTAQYYRGDKTFVDLPTDVRASTLTGLSPATGNIAASDTVLEAFGKLLNTQTDYVSKTDNTIANTITGQVTVNTIGALKLTYTPTNATDAVNKSYVDSVSPWTVSSGNIYRSTGNVGIGTITPSEPLTVVGSPSNAKMATFTNQSGTDGAGLIGYRDNGATTIQSGSRIGYLIFGGNKDTSHNMANGTAITSFSNQNWSNSANGASIAFETTLNSTTARVERMRIDHNGNVGIGTTTPTEKLDVAGNIVSITGSIGAGGVPASNVRGIYYAGGTSVVPLVLKAAAGQLANLFQIQDSASAGLVTVDSTGKVGVGTTSPNAKIHINDSGANGNYFKATNSVSTTGFDVGVSSSGSGVLYQRDNYPVIIGTNNLERVRIDNAGNVGIGTTSPRGTLEISGAGSAVSSSAAPNGLLVLTGTTSNVSLSAGTDVVTAVPYSWLQSRHSTAGPAYYALSLNPRGGNVGIGTTAPNKPLEVNGDIRAARPGVATQFVEIGGSTGSSTFVRMQSASVNQKVATIDAIIDSGVPSSLNGFAIRNGVLGSEVTRLAIDYTGNVGIGTSSPGYTLDVAGTVRATTYLYSSDARLKKDIHPVQDAFKKVLMLRGVEFSWKVSKEKALGFIAQEVEKVFPQLVKTDAKSSYKSVEYANISAILVQAIKEFRSVDIEEKSVLKKRIESLELMNHEMAKRLERLEEKQSSKQ